MSETPVIPVDPLDWKPKKRGPGRPKGYRPSQRIEVLKKRIELEKAMEKLKPKKPFRRRVSGIGEQIALVPGGIFEFMIWARAAALREPRLKPVADNFSLLPVEHQTVMQLEAMCKTYGIDEGDLFGEAAKIAFERKRDQTRMIASVAMPMVMKKNIEQAKLAKGVEDRRMFMQVTGLLPTPRGSVVNVATQFNSNVTNDGESSGLTSFEDSVVSFSEIIRNAVEPPPRGLPEPIEISPTDEDV